MSGLLRRFVTERLCQFSIQQQPVPLLVPQMRQHLKPRYRERPWQEATAGATTTTGSPSPVGSN